MVTSVWITPPVVGVAGRTDELPEVDEQESFAKDEQANDAVQEDEFDAVGRFALGIVAKSIDRQIKSQQANGGNDQKHTDRVGPRGGLINPGSN